MRLLLASDIPYSRGTRGSYSTISNTLPQECLSIAQMCEGQRVSGCNKDADSVTVTNMAFYMSASYTPRVGCTCSCVCSLIRLHVAC